KREPDEQRRRSLASLAVTFAELTRCQDVWLDGLKGFTVNESKLWRQIRQEGQREERRSTLVRVLQAKRKEALPADLLARINGQADLDVLSHWFDLALTQPTVEEFVAALDR